jgi:TldD protein
MTDRRTFLQQMASAAALTAAARLAHAEEPDVVSAIDAYPQAGDPKIRELAARALDAARAAGASYADVRFTLTRSEQIFTAGLSWFLFDDNEHGAAGVRALVDGAWGFAASPVWEPDELARLGRDAATQARHNARGRRTRIELGDPPPVATGEWTTPVKRDPFTVPIPEKIETMWAFNEVPMRADADGSLSGSFIVRHRRQQKTFASTDGSFITQTLYWTHPWYSVSFGVENRQGVARVYDRLHPAAGGWELVSEARVLDDIPRLIDDATRMVEAERITPDRYDVVFDAVAVGQLLAPTIGAAAELDRAMGYEANAAGTSYLGPPDERLGRFSLGPSMLNVKADRSRASGGATVKWDDEGITPSSYDVIRAGTLAGYHTTRELAAASRNRADAAAGRSKGGSFCENAKGFPILQTPNVELVPGTSDSTFDDLVAGLDRGLVICGGQPEPGGFAAGGVTIDRQQLNGEISGNMAYEVRNGRRTRFVRGEEALFRAPELWKSLAALGGPRSRLWSGHVGRKGQPSQEYWCGIGAVPALFRRVAVTDVTRKA